MVQLGDCCLETSPGGWNQLNVLPDRTYKRGPTEMRDRVQVYANILDECTRGINDDTCCDQDLKELAIVLIRCEVVVSRYEHEAVQQAVNPCRDEEGAINLVRLSSRK